MAAMNPVLECALYIMELSSGHVEIDETAIDDVVSKMTSEEVQSITGPKAFDEEMHFSDGGPLTAQYLLVVDALNFCFWPDGELQYVNMSKGVKAAVLHDPSCISAEALSAMTGAGVRALFGWHRDVPLQEERARLLREVGSGLLKHFGGQASRLVEAAGQSAMALVQLVACHFPGFRDQAIYKGRQVFLYKRAQIFAGDLFGAFQGRGLGAFTDMHLVTMFADYRVPVVLQVMGILKYSPELNAKVVGKVEIAPCSEEELEIRAATIVAVEKLQIAIALRFGAADSPADVANAPTAALQMPCAVQLDWWLWHKGERDREVHPPHHRTLTVFY